MNHAGRKAIIAFLIKTEEAQSGRGVRRLSGAYNQTYEHIQTQSNNFGQRICNDVDVRGCLSAV
jgi:hypothetical protein